MYVKASVAIDDEKILPYEPIGCEIITHRSISI